MPIYKLTIGGEKKTIDKKILDDNYDDFVKKYPDARIEAFSNDQEAGSLPITNYRKALERGYRFDFPDQVNQAEMLQEKVGALKKETEKRYIDTSKRVTEKATEEDEAFKEKSPFLHFLSEGAKMIKASKSGIYETPTTHNEEIAQLQATRNKLHESEEIIKESQHAGKGFWEDNFFAGAGRGIGSRLSTPSFYDMGMTDMKDNATLLLASKKMETGEKLTPAEQSLVDAAALNMTVNGEFGDQLGDGYKAGKVTADAIPFMAEFAANPLSGLGKAAVKKFGVTGLKKVITRTTGDLLGSAGMTLSTGIARTAADATHRTTGETQPLYNENGYFIGGDNFAGGESPFKATTKAIGASTIENFSEMFGNYFSPITTAAGVGVTKGLNKIGLSSVTDVVSKIKASDMSAMVNDFTRRTQFNGVIGEFAEEQVGAILNSMTVGDQKWNDAFNLETFFGVSLMGGFLTGVKAVGYRDPVKQAERKLERANQVALKELGDEFPMIKETIESTENEDLTKVVTPYLINDGYSTPQKKAIAEYTSRLMIARGASWAEYKRRSEGDVPTEQQQLEESFKMGVDAAMANSEIKRGIKTALDDRASQFDDQTLSILNGNNYLNHLSELMSDGKGVSKELDYLNTKARYDGMIQGIRDGIDNQIEMTLRTIDENSHRDGNIYEVASRVDAKETFNIIGDSDLFLNEDGTLNFEKSSQRVIVRNRNNSLEMRPLSDFSSEITAYNSAEVKETESNRIREEEAMRVAAEIEPPIETNKPLFVGSEIKFQVGDREIDATIQSMDDDNVVLHFDEPQTMEDGRRFASIAVPRSQLEQKKSLQPTPSNPTYGYAESGEGAEEVSSDSDNNKPSFEEEIVTLEEQGMTNEDILAYAEQQITLLTKDLTSAEKKAERQLNGVRSTEEYAFYKKRKHELLDDINAKIDDWKRFSSYITGKTITTDPLAESQPEKVTISEPKDPITETPFNDQLDQLRSTGMTESDVDDYVEMKVMNLDRKMKVAQKAMKGIPKREFSPEEFALYRKKQREELELMNQELTYWKDLKKQIESQKMITTASAEIAGEASTKTAAREEEARQLNKQAEADFSTIKEKFQSGVTYEGLEDEIYNDAGEAIKGRYVLIDAFAVTPSHNPFDNFNVSRGFPVTKEGKTINDRDYHSDKNAQLLVENHAAAYDQRAIQKPVFVTPDGVVISGNDRTMASQLAAQNKSDGAYNNYLKQNVERFGFTKEQYETILHPRLLFMTNHVSYDTNTFSKFNRDDKKTATSTERAIAFGKKLSDAQIAKICAEIDTFESLSAFYKSESAIASLMKGLIGDHVIGENELSELVTIDPHTNSITGISAIGEEFVENMLIGSIFEEDAVRLIGANKGIRQSIIRALSPMIENKKLGDYSFRRELSNGVEMISEARSRGMSIEEFLSIGNLFEGDAVTRYGEGATLMATALSKGNNVFREFMNQYNDLASEALDYGNNKDLFNGKQKSKEEIINELYNQHEINRRREAGNTSESNLYGYGQGDTGESPERRYRESTDNRTDLHQRVSPGTGTSKNEINRRMEEASAIVRREKETATDAERTTGYKGKQAKALIDYARKEGIWIDDISTLGEFLSSGGENEVYSKDDETVYKLNNFEYAGDDISNFFDRIKVHNELFPEVTYTIVGYAINSKGATCAVMEQPFVLSEREATEEEISDYMTSIGFEEDYSDEFHNEDYSVFDAVPNNVLMGIDGKLYFIDTQIAPIEKESKESNPDNEANISDPLSNSDETTEITNDDTVKNKLHPINDFGEKIGGAKKDMGIVRGTKKENIGIPAWRRKYSYANSDKSITIGGTIDTSKPFCVYYKVEKRIMGRKLDQLKYIEENGNLKIFNTEEEAERYLPIYEVEKQSYRIRQDKETEKYYIYRISSVGKEMRFDEFETKEEATVFLHSTEGATSLLNRRAETFSIPELTTITRSGKDYRNGEGITEKEFSETFKFRGVEFGNWVKNEERQEMLNLAYDAFMDLSSIINISPEALSLGGELSISFGSRGTMDTKAQFHPTYATINLNRMNGAGSLAHEFAHALDNYLHFQDVGTGYKRDQDGKVTLLNRTPYITEVGKIGTRGVRKEILDILKEISVTMRQQKIEKPIDLATKEEALQEAKLDIKKELERLRTSFAKGIHRYKYNRKTKQRDLVAIQPTEEHLKRYDELSTKILSPDFIHPEYEWEPTKEFLDLSALYKEVFGSRPYEEKYGIINGGLYYNLSVYIRRYIAKEKELVNANENKSEKATIKSNYLTISNKFDNSRAEIYYSKNVELFARAFESFIIDRMKSMSLVNDYLNYDKREIYENIYNMHPYPDGAERIKLNQLFQNFFDTLEERDENGHILLFREGEVSPLAQTTFGRKRVIEQRAIDLAASLNTPIHLADYSELPKNHKKAKGFYDPKNREIVIFPENHRNESDIESTVLHEVVAHKGLRELFGNHFNEFLETLYKDSTPSVKAKITALSQRREWDVRLATEEYLAQISEQGIQNPTFWSRVKHLFMQMLKSVGVKLNTPISDGDLRYVLWRSFKNLQNGHATTLLEKAEDAAMRQKFRSESDSKITEKNNTLKFREEIPEEASDGYSISAKEYYNEQMSRRTIKGRINWQDKMMAAEILQKAVALETGEEIADFENFYLHENHSNSRSTVEMNEFREHYLNKIVQSFSELMSHENTKNDINIYLMAKHGLERNLIFAWKQAVSNRAKREYNLDMKIASKEEKKSVESVEVRVAKWNTRLKEKLDVLDDKEYFSQLEQTMNSILPLPKKLKHDYSGLTELAGELSKNPADYESIAQSYVNDFEKRNDTTQLWNNIHAATRKTLKKSQESGLMTQSTCREVSEMFRYYIPLRGWSKHKAEDVYEYIKAESGQFNASLMKTRGRKSMADDPIATISNMAQSAIIQGNKNLVKQKLLNLAQNHSTSLLTVFRAWEVWNEAKEDWERSLPEFSTDDTPERVEAKRDEHRTRMIELAEQGKARESKKGLALNGLHVTTEQTKQHVIEVRSGGIDYVIYVNGNPIIAQAINGLLRSDNPSEKRFARNYKKLLKLESQLVTSKNPDFIMSNFFRDMGYANFNAFAKNGIEYEKKFASNYINNHNILKLALKYNQGTLNVKNEQERLFKEFVENGGRTGYAYIESVETEKRKIEKLLKRLQGGDIQKVKKSMGELFSMLGEFSGSIEDLARFTAYQTSRQTGKSILKSISDAKEITVNFDRRGVQNGLAGFFANNFMFFNAAVQGLTNFSKTIKENKERAIPTCFGAMALGATIPFINELLISLLGDDDDKGAYNELNEYERRNNLCLFAGGAWIKIPLSIELRSLYALGDIFYRVTTGKAKYENVALDVAGTVASLLPINPFGDGDLVSTLTPSLFVPIVDVVITNENYAGRKISNQTDFNKLDPEWKRIYDNSTNRTFVEISKGLSLLSGGDDFRRGVVEFNPANMEHLWDSYLGGIGQLANKVIKLTDEIVNDKEVQIRNIPVVNRILRDRYNAMGGAELQKAYKYYQDQYIKWNHEYKGVRSSLNKGLFDYAEKYQEMSSNPESVKMRLFGQHYNYINELYDKIKEYDDAEMTTQLQEMIKAQKLEVIELMESD